MRISILAVFVLAATAGRALASPLLESDPVGRRLNERALRAAQDGADPMQRDGTQGGSHRVLALDDLDAPEAVKQQLRKDIVGDQASRQNAGAEIPSVESVLASLPRTQHSARALRQRLPAAPSNLQATRLGAAELIGMEPSGAIDGLQSSGLTRYYRLPDIGIVEFSEDSFRAAGRHIEVIADMQNVRINGALGRREVYTDAYGRSRIALAWTRHDKTYALVAITGAGTDAQRTVGVLGEIAAAVVD